MVTFVKFSVDSVIASVSGNSGESTWPLPHFIFIRRLLKLPNIMKVFSITLDKLLASLIIRYFTIFYQWNMLIPLAKINFVLVWKTCYKITEFVFGKGCEEPFDFTFFDFFEPTVNEIVLWSLSRCARRCSAIPEKSHSIWPAFLQIFFCDY